MKQGQLERFLSALEKRQEECLKILEDPEVKATDPEVINSLNLFAQLDKILSNFQYVPDTAQTPTKVTKIIPMADINNQEEKGE